MARVPTIDIPVKVVSGYPSVTARPVAAGAICTTNSIAEKAEVLLSVNTDGLQTRLHVEVLTGFRVGLEQLASAGTLTTPLEVEVYRLTREDLQGTLEMEFVVDVFKVDLGTLRGPQRRQMHLEHVREEHCVSIYLHHPIMGQILLAFLQLLPMLDEGIGIDVGAPRSLRCLPAGQDGVSIALVDAELLLLNVVRNRSLLALPIHNHEAEERRALQRDALLRLSKLTHLTRPSDDNTRVPRRRLHALRCPTLLLIAREALAVLEVPRARCTVTAL
mmetsp:Transcript_139381/g.353471  ORF Transcript_139381/g.353471 Transcript_139381/m.353471 type:complete len:275 (-) Transcript_139381:1533-2357(-)